MKITKKQLKRIIKEEMEALLKEDDCGMPPSDEQQLWAWAECKCRDVGTNRKDPAYIKCMEEWIGAEDERQATGYEDFVEEGLTGPESRKAWDEMNQAANPERGKNLVSPADLKKMYRDQQKAIKAAAKKTRIGKDK